MPGLGFRSTAELHDHRGSAGAAGLTRSMCQVPETAPCSAQCPAGSVSSRAAWPRSPSSCGSGGRGRSASWPSARDAWRVERRPHHCASQTTEPAVTWLSGAAVCVADGQQSSASDEQEHCQKSTARRVLALANSHSRRAPITLIVSVALAWERSCLRRVRLRVLSCSSSH